MAALSEVEREMLRDLLARVIKANAVTARRDDRLPILKGERLSSSPHSEREKPIAS